MFKLSIVGKITLGAIILYTITVTVLECLVISYHVSFVGNFRLSDQGEGISLADLIYHAIFIFSLVFQIILVLDALWRRNIIQMLALVVFNLLALAYSSIQLYQHKILEDQGTQDAFWLPEDVNRFSGQEDAKRYFESKMRPLEYTIIGIVVGFSITLALLSYKLTTEFGWENYKTYSADVEVRNAYTASSILQALTKLDVFFVVSYAVQLVPSQQIGYSTSMFETVIIFIVGLSMVTLSWYAVTQEQKYVVLVVINLLILSEIYLVYRLVRVNIPRTDGVDPYKFTRRFLSFFLGTTAVLVMFTIIYGVICFRNMQRGTYVLTVYGIDDEKVEDYSETGFEQRQSKRKSKIQDRISTTEARRVTLD